MSLMDMSLVSMATAAVSPPFESGGDGGSCNVGGGGGGWAADSDAELRSRGCSAVKVGGPASALAVAETGEGALAWWC